MSIEKDLEQIVSGPGTKADRARALFDLGCDRNDVVELLSMSYSQAHSIWKRRHGDGDGGSSASSRPRRLSRSADLADDEGGPRVVVPTGSAGRNGSTRYLRLSPSQTRYITQGGHVVVRVDLADGPRCTECRQSVTFSLQYLGFVHAGSFDEPTAIEDHYQ